MVIGDQDAAVDVVDEDVDDEEGDETGVGVVVDDLGPNIGYCGSCD